MSLNSINSFEAYLSSYQESIGKPEQFWENIAKNFTWKKAWDSVLQWNFEEPNIKWFSGGKLNISENCLDVHLEQNGDKIAFIWEPNSPDENNKTITYRELHQEVCKFANVLKNLGVEKGDRVCMYMPMIPELAIACLATARIGAIHSVVFAGFSAASLSDRIHDSACKILITADGSYRGNKVIDLKSIVDEALESCPSIEKCVVVERTQTSIHWVSGRDVWYHELMNYASDQCEPVYVDAEDELFILYTSGSTGKPKGVVHTTGGYMVYTAYTFKNVFQYQPEQVFWCTADIGWITGHSYIIYGPLLNGATSILFEGIPTYPDAGRFWQVIDKHKVNIFYTAPTAIRSLMAESLDYVNQHDLSTLEVLGSVGEPINEEAWNWYHKNIGKGKCPIVDTWWQTETGGIMISALAGISPTKASFAGQPLPGIQAVLLDKEGNEITENEVEGTLCIRFPWPGIIRTTWQAHDRCKQNYFSQYKNYYFTGDAAKRDKDGLYRIIGRMDDVINVSGHRIGTAELENAINHTDSVIESAVVGYPHEIKGQGIYAFVIAENQSDETLRHITESLVKLIGPIAKPDKVQLVSGLPKTRSGKIMRRILRKIACNEIESIGDTSTLLNPQVVDEIILNKLS